MGKRKRKEKSAYLKDKLRRLEDRLRKYEDSSNSSDDDDDCRPRSPHRYYYSRSPSLTHTVYLTDSEDRDDTGQIRSVVTPVPAPQVENVCTTPAVPPADNPLPSTSEQGTSSNTLKDNTSLPDEILEALGDPKGKDEKFGPKIPEEISKRWGRILVDGLTKEQKQDMMEKTLIPENFRIVKAPLLNPEIPPVLGDAIKNRDKLLEKAQNHLGLGIASLTNLATNVIEGDLTKIEILRKISDASQIFLDLHHENTITRKKLIMSSLDKRFNDIIKDAKRDSFLFGSELGEKIKASKTAERSGLHIKRKDAVASSSRKFSNQGNWKGPPRSQGQRAYKPSGPKYNRYAGQSSRRPQAAARPTPAAKTSATTR